MDTRDLSHQPVVNLKATQWPGCKPPLGSLKDPGYIGDWLAPWVMVALHLAIHHMPHAG